MQAIARYASSMWRLLPILMVLLVGCVGVEPEPLLDDEGEPIEVPDAFDTWLGINSIIPASGEISPRPIIELAFDTYIEDDDLLSYDLVSLQSGGIRARGIARWDISRRTLIWRPSTDLTEGLEYTLRINEERLRSVTGSPPRFRGSRRYTVTTEIESPSPTPIPRVGFDEVETIISRKCASCHRDPEWKLNPLTRDSMIGEEARDRDQLLVIRRDAADSYLMHKILDDYPLRSYGVQPPTWSDASPLTDAEIRTFQHWIESGAP